MKFNFKKIASVLTSTVMLSSTVAFAAAANFPQPFVTEGGVGNYAIVVGADAAGADANAATQLDSFLEGLITDTDDGDITPITIEGDSFMLEKGSNKFNLGDALNSTYQSLDDDELSTMLAEGVYEDESGDEYDYTQSMALKGTGITLTHFADSDVNENEEPVIGFDIASNVQLMSYTLDFTDKPTYNAATMETTTLTFLGKSYYVSDVSTAGAVTLLDSANSAVVTATEPVSVTVGDKTYEVEIVSVDDTADNEKATLKVDGVKLSTTALGASRKIGTDTYISILDLSEAGYAGDDEWVEFSIGSGQIVLTAGAEVEINDEAVDGLTVDIVNTTTLDTMTFNWTTEEQTFLVPGEELVMPGFESVKLIMGDFVTADEPETVEFKYSGDDYAYLTASVKDGDVTIPLLYFGGDSTINNLGSDSDEVLVTSRGATLSVNENNNSIFVATSVSNDEAESYVFQVTGITEKDSGVKNETTIKNLASGESTTVSVSDASGEEIDFGEVTLTISGVNADAGSATVALSGTGSLYADRIVTAEGLTIALPVLGNSTTSTMAGSVLTAESVNATSTTWIAKLTEEHYDTGNIAAGGTFNVTLGYASDDGPQVSSITGISTKAVNDDSDDTEGYLVSNLATKVFYREGDDQKTLDVMYNGEEAYAQVYVAEGAATSNDGGSTSGSMVVQDSEVSTVSSKNLIVLGGTCVNKVAAKVLNVDAQYPVCGDAWVSLTGIGAGEFLVQTVTSPYSTGKVAMLVAGYAQTDTANAASALEASDDVVVAAGEKYVNSGTTLTKG